MNHAQIVQLATDIRTAIAECTTEYSDCESALQDAEIRQYVIDYIRLIHETDRQAPEPTADDIRAIIRDVTVLRDESFDDVIDSGQFGTEGALIRATRARLQVSNHVSPWGRGRLIEYATVLCEMIDAGMGDMTLIDAVEALNDLDLEDP